ncbi:hypothetical protein M0R19_00050 [Candidatus Pacearchaeota archaeon]|jgi:hypothetical protein|nr:hypothetical protein [Candidatus Pacearchaeota archaeon]
MTYQIEVDYVSNACGVTYWPEKTFEYKGNIIEACNYRMNQILETNEYGLDDTNITRARVYKFPKGKDKYSSIEVLVVDYREGELKIDFNIKDFVIKI